MRRTSSALFYACLLGLLLFALAGCTGEADKGADPWPLAEDAQTLEELLPDEDLRASALRVLGSKRPWRLSGIDAAAGDDLIEGLPNELDEESFLELVIGARPWTTGCDIIRKGSGFTMRYQLSDVVPKGYVRVEALVAGWDEEGYHCTLTFEVIMREADAVPVQAAMTSIATNDAEAL